MIQYHADFSWEQMYAPYDLSTYQAALKQVSPDDIVLDIGAGDLRFARKMAQIARKVYAVEIYSDLIDQARAQNPFPNNLIAICSDARTWDFPADITLGVLLMRHCTHFQLYAEKLQISGAKKLITNARWRMNVEAVDLHSAQRRPYNELEMGWFACWCGNTGFKPGPTEKITTDLMNTTYEVWHCLQCLLPE